MIDVLALAFSIPLLWVIAAILILRWGGSVKVNRYKSFSFHPIPKVEGNILYWYSSAWQLTWR